MPRMTLLLLFVLYGRALSAALARAGHRSRAAAPPPTPQGVTASLGEPIAGQPGDGPPPATPS